MPSSESRSDVINIKQAPAKPDNSYYEIFNDTLAASKSANQEEAEPVKKTAAAGLPLKTIPD